MLFTGDVQCVYCGYKIKFSGNIILYQSHQCANHNQEHQFPGMNIVVDEGNNNNTYFTHLPATTQRSSVSRIFKRPTILRPKTSAAGTLDPLHINGVKQNARFKKAQINNSALMKPIMQNITSGENVLFLVIVYT